MTFGKGETIDLASTVTAFGETQLSAPGSPATTTAPALATNRFAQVSQLGAGGMGVVERVWDGDLMRELAIKRVRPELRQDARVVAMFLWEARVTAYLDHPNIVPVHDLARTAAGDPYFAMKRVVGTSLEEMLARLRGGDSTTAQRWSLRRRIRALHQACMGVAFAHQRGVLHRDLKPANIMLGDNGEVMIMDWGLAIPLPGAAGDRLRTVLPSHIDSASAGTPLYMSPEQSRGGSLDERSDVYSLGIVLYELASLSRPYEGATSKDILARVAQADVRPIREAWPEVPPALGAIIDVALQREPDARYATVRELAADLERFMDGGSPVAEHAPAVKQLARFYMSRDRRLSQLRVLDIDMLAASCTAFGIALGVLGASWIGHWWWLAVVACVLAAIPPIRSWRRATRAASAGQIGGMS